MTHNFLMFCSASFFYFYLIGWTAAKLQKQKEDAAETPEQKALLQIEDNTGRVFKMLPFSFLWMMFAVGAVVWGPAVTNVLFILDVVLALGLAGMMLRRRVDKKAEREQA